MVTWKNLLLYAQAGYQLRVGSSMRRNNCVSNPALSIVFLSYAQFASKPSPPSLPVLYPYIQANDRLRCPGLCRSHYLPRESVVPPSVPHLLFRPPSVPLHPPRPLHPSCPSFSCPGLRSLMLASSRAVVIRHRSLHFPTVEVFFLTSLFYFDYATMYISRVRAMHCR